MMRQRQHIDYIYCTCRDTKWQWNIVKEQGCCMLHMEFGGLTREKGRKKAARLLRRFEAQKVVIGADAEAAELLQMEAVLFAARQQEMLEHQDYIIDSLMSVDKDSRRRRRRLLIVLESLHWGRKELMQCILGAKDRFEDIAICVLTQSVEIDSMVEDIYEEWGIVIDILSMNQVRHQHFHMVYFFVTRWRESMRLCCDYEVAYLLSDEPPESAQYTLRKGVRVYAGLKYAIQGRRLRGDYARNLAYQQPEEYQKKGISVVAICEGE